MSQTTLPSEDASQATIPSPAPSSRLGRWLARAFLGLWWAFATALATSIVSSLGNHAGPLIIPLLPQALGWIRAQPLWIRIVLGTLVLGVLAFMGWLTYLAWKRRQEQADEEIEAHIAQQQEAFAGALERDVKPGLDALQARVDEGVQRDAAILTVAEDIQIDVKKLVRAKPLPLVRELTRDLFKMGDPFAENMEYYRKPPIEGVFAAATEALRAAAELPGRAVDAPPVVAVGPDARRGIVIMGEANVGKSRLMFEALTATLPEWSALLWSEARTTAEIPPSEGLRDRDVVIVLDDLHLYTPTAGAVSVRVQRDVGLEGVAIAPLKTGESGAAAVLRDLLGLVRRDARRTLIVATYRSEHKRVTEAELNWLLAQLVEICVPRLSEDANDPQAADILAFFHAHGVLDPKSEWDGTIGSGVLGLKEKRAEYQGLVERDHPAALILRAMKLLMLSGVTEHTERRVRRVCSTIFEERALRDNERVWRNAVGRLLDLQFIRMVEERGGEGQPMLVARKDTYFEHVVHDYPDSRIPGHLERDRAKLPQVFADLRDASALGSLGDAFLNKGGRYHDALDCYEQALTVRPTYVHSWVQKGRTLFFLHQPDEALAALEQALILEPRNGALGLPRAVFC